VNLAPKGRLRKAQGASPEGAKQLLRLLERRPAMAIYLELQQNFAAPPFEGFRNVNREPRACALGFPAGPLRGPRSCDRN